MRLYLIFLSLLSLLLTACGLQQTVDLDLPEYEPEVVVECYLEPGQPNPNRYYEPRFSPLDPRRYLRALGEWLVHLTN